MAWTPRVSPSPLSAAHTSRKATVYVKVTSIAHSSYKIPTREPSSIVGFDADRSNAKRKAAEANWKLRLSQMLSSLKNGPRVIGISD